MKYDQHKWITFFLTFASYSGLHMMRMAYSHSKPNFKHNFQETNLFLGLFDALTYISLALGFFFRFRLQKQAHLTKSFFRLITICSLGYCLLPILGLALGEKVLENQVLRVGIPALSLMLFGFFQFPAWPSLMTITCQHFDIKSEGKAIGIWSANGDFGNIIGFTISGILVDILSLRWQISMITVALINWTLALLVYLLVDEYHRDSENDSSLIEEQQTRESGEEQDGRERFNGFLAYCKEAISLPANKLYLLSMGLTKAILYGFLLWMPTYLAHNGMNSYTSIIPIIFNAGTLLGSFLLGHLYEDLEDNASYLQHHLKKYSLVYSCLGVILSLALFYLLQKGVGFYFIMSMISGAFLGGCFNMLASNEVVSITQGHRQSINYLSTLSMVVGNLMVGTVELIIGVVLNMKNDSAGERKLFIILVVVGFLTISVLLCRINMISSEKSEESISNK